MLNEVSPDARCLAHLAASSSSSGQSCVIGRTGGGVEDLEHSCTDFAVFISK
jgi:hypothetical protein